MVRSIFTLLLLTSGLAVASAAGAAGKEPSCTELRERRAALITQSQALTSSVEAKNTELGETADALKAAGSEGRKKELERRREGLRRELSTLLDRELSSVNELGALDKQISTRCGKGGGK